MPQPSSSTPNVPEASIRRGTAEEDADDACTEQQPLLSGSNGEVAASGPSPAAFALRRPAAEQQQQQQQQEQAQDQPLHSSTTLSAKRSASGEASGPAQCRICLEEDVLPSLEAPCGCAGTQRYAHRRCIQRWIDEKANGRCEVCGQLYQGEYVVPERPPSPGPEARSAAAAAARQQLAAALALAAAGAASGRPGEPLRLGSPLGGLYLTITEDERLVLTRHRPGTALGAAAAAETHTADDEWDDMTGARQPALSWCVSMMLFLFMLSFLHGAVVAPADAAAAAAAAASGVPADAGAPAAAAAAAAGSMPSAAAGLAAGASLLLLWLLTKLFLVVLPLLLVMRLAARAHDAETEAGDSSAAAMVDLELQALRAHRAVLERLGGRDRNTAGAGEFGHERGQQQQQQSSSSLPPTQQQHQQHVLQPGVSAPHDGIGTAEQRVLAAARAAVRATLSAAQRGVAQLQQRLDSQQQQQPQPLQDAHQQQQQQQAVAGTAEGQRLSGVV